MRDIRARMTTVYIQCGPAFEPECAHRIRNAQRGTNYLQKAGNEFRHFVIGVGYHAASPFCLSKKYPR